MSLYKKKQIYSYLPQFVLTAQLGGFPFKTLKLFNGKNITVPTLPGVMLFATSSAVWGNGVKVFTL